MESAISELFRPSAAATEQPLQQRLSRILRAVRMHLGMDVAFVSEFTNGSRVFRHVDASHPEQPVQVGGSDPLEQTYCQRVVDGRLPELIREAGSLSEARTLAVTDELPVGAHLSVPIRLKDRRVYGTFCCFRFTPDHSLNERDLAMMRVLADLAAEQIDEDLEADRLKAEAEARIKAVLADDSVTMVYQPIYQLAENAIVGFESLARFSATPRRSPDVWFAEAAQVGLGIPLELRAMQRALQAVESFRSDVYVSVNVAPDTILTGNLARALSGQPLERIVLEVTEHAAITHYAGIASVVGPLRDRGLRIAVDDAGAGYASFRHILSLAPDVIKLDVSMTRNIDRDASRRALARALIGFAEATNSRIVAEGVENESELAVLRGLGVNKAQGYFLGRPMQLADAARLAGNPTRASSSRPRH